jgi:hypothetical protein
VKPANDDDSELQGFVYSARFEAELEAIEPNSKAAHQIIHSLEFALMRQPERGFPVEGTPYRIWPVYDRHGNEYVVYYRIGERVEALSIVSANDEMPDF